MPLIDVLALASGMLIPVISIKYMTLPRKRRYRVVAVVREEIDSNEL